MRVAVITNPQSSRNKRHLHEVRRLLDARVTHCVNESAGDLPRVLERLANEGVTLIGINGGDGTVHQVLTVLARSRSFVERPTIALIPGGSTNMSARDINGGALSLRVAIRSFLAATGVASTPIRRELIRVSDGSGEEKIGFVFGMGAIIRGIEYCHARIFALGIRQEWASGVAMMRAAWGIARREPIFAEGVALETRLDDECHAGRASIFLVSTLQRLFLGIRPFWGHGPGSLAVTWVSEDARRFLPTFPALLRGDASRLHEENGFLSRQVDRIEVTGNDLYTIDGEIYRASGTRISLAAHGPLPFIALKRPS